MSKIIISKNEMQIGRIAGDTVLIFVTMNEKVKKILSDLIADSTEFQLEIEYWKDVKQYHYFIDFGDETVVIDDYINKKTNNYVAKFLKIA